MRNGCEVDKPFAPPREVSFQREVICAGSHRDTSAFIVGLRGLSLNFCKYPFLDRDSIVTSKYESFINEKGCWEMTACERVLVKGLINFLQRTNSESSSPTCSTLRFFLSTRIPAALDEVGVRQTLSCLGGCFGCRLSKNIGDFK